MSWKRKLATLKSKKADVSSVSPSSDSNARNPPTQHHSFFRNLPTLDIWRKFAFGRKEPLKATSGLVPDVIMFSLYIFLLSTIAKDFLLSAAKDQKGLNNSRLQFIDATVKSELFVHKGKFSFHRHCCNKTRRPIPLLLSLQLLYVILHELFHP